MSLQPAQSVSPDLPAVNRREHTRVGASHGFTLTAQGRSCAVVTANLSLGGAFFSTSEWLPVGTRIDVAFPEPQTALSCAARIVHQGTDGVGVRFLDPDTAFVDALAELIAGDVARSAQHGADESWVPGRIALYTRLHGRFEVLFTTHLGPHGIWVLSNSAQSYPGVFPLTLSERGLFDCQAQVQWRTDAAMGLKFLLASDEFYQAYHRVLEALTDG